MNSIHNNGKNNGSLNEGLDKLSHAYGQLQQDEPPELLDQAILNSAHRALEKKPHWMKFGWLHGLTTAAVFILALSVILNQREPVPVYESGMRNNEPVRLQGGKAAKKQSVGELEALPDEMNLEIKVKSETRQDTFKSVPVTAAPESVAKEASPEAQVTGAHRSIDAPESLQAKTVSVDNDAAVVELMVESEAKARAKTDSKLEQRLLAIIKLKQSGDETWKTELESFKESYPDYPLPNELKVP